MKPITEYLDYRQYLQDFYEMNKERNSYFSYRYMGKRLKMDPGTLFKILQGEVHVPVKRVPFFAEFMGLNSKETEYLEMMVRFGRAKTERDTKMYFEKLLNMQGVNSQLVEAKKYALYQRWYHTAVWALLGYYKFSGDYQSLAKKLSPPVTPRQAKASIALLEDLGFIKKNKDGYYELTSEKITTGEKWHSAAIHSFQKETIKMAGESLERHHKKLRDISSVTVAINSEDLDEIKARAKDFRQSVLKLKTGNPNLNAVYQVNVQIIPLTEIGKE